MKKVSSLFRNIWQYFFPPIVERWCVFNIAGKSTGYVKGKRSCRGYKPIQGGLLEIYVCDTEEQADRLLEILKFTDECENE